MTTEKEILLAEINHEIEWLLGSSPITINIRREILIYKTLKYIVEKLP